MAEVFRCAEYAGVSFAILALFGCDTTELRLGISIGNGGCMQIADRQRKDTDMKRVLLTGAAGESAGGCASC